MADDAPVTTGDLVAGWRSRSDREAIFRQLFESRYRRVYRFFSRRGVTAETCRDLSQETFLCVYRGLDRFRGDSSFDTWLYQIAVNVHRGYLRAATAARRQAAEISIEDPAVADAVASPVPEPLAATLGRERRSRLLAAVERLPETMRRCFRLRFEQGLSYRQIGSQLGLTERSVKTYQYLARRRLRADCGPPSDDPENDGGGEA